ncbi:molybdate ABC transporter substrate-binding protein [Halomonas garicola]|uniref:molybdate ABC transporter substrate-binding protein n=1 Tax=Halomonas garicola TaxID=1690008 RepID=UPI00289A3B09|nr:molybdate ABC transporter substrate-binding protein [Halomonas garicola]
MHNASSLTSPLLSSSPFSSLKPLRLAAVLTALGVAGAAQAGTLHVAAAASMTDAMNDAIEAYTAEHEAVDIVPVYASSSTLARQIASGSPAEVYISANQKWMDWLEDEGVDVAQRVDLLQNRLALVAPADEAGDDFTPGESGELASLLDDGERLAVGDPAHVPAGIYAKQAFEALGEWDALEPRLARASDVRSALALVERGETPAGVVYQTDARASNGVATLGLFPLETHDAIVYPAALIDSGDNDDAAAFRAWLEGSQAMSIFEEHGFASALDD